MISQLKNNLNPSSQEQDPFVTLLGHFGRWQFMVFASISMVKLSFGWVQMAILFLTPNLTFRCVNLPNATGELLNNTCYDGCVQYEYDTSPFDNTIVSEWDLICDRRWLASFTQTMLQLGVLIGSILFGFLSDRYGRRYTFLLTVAMVVVIGNLVPFSTSYTMFTSLRTLHGLVIAGSVLIAFVIVMESVGPKYREAAGCLYQIPFIIGHITVSPFAYFFRTWDKYMLAMSLPTLLYLGYFFTVSESPRWLVSQGRVDEAITIVKKAAVMNKLPTTKIEETLTQISHEQTHSANKPKLNYLALFRRSLLLKTVCSCMMWFITGIIFYGFNQYISQTSPDPFVSVALAGLIQIPSNIISIWLMKKLGRRFTTSAFFILCGFFVVLLYIVPQIFTITLILGTLGVSCSCVVASAIYVYTSELYPTVVRNMGVGAGSTAMRVGSMIAPFITNTVDDVPWLPTAVFGVSAVVAGLVGLLLPETKGTVLVDNIESDSGE